ncbi:MULTISPECIES: fluoride efflux transporter CrcB [Halomonadaceae]|jgi:CrcB protein|uniref:fluoride efflux transporter CrcB n=1 Tax=Halomonadaceae TaxID=28256 RepID=UPI0015831541|nr:MULTISPECIES: fluoride efflux transporter CrcB [Halomonas]MDI4636739.1 fluoride efflux transporter CrcB [Halomonas sp. BMC7]NUJ61102.1 fluoride efflux transporter CrcB [Halomonas taeanensis]|tara:strand:- start:9281 stop:9679 length:399 start_codon:yes stop_codon:yes gene_type:complete
MWLSILAVSGGAAIGANARWLLGVWLNHYYPAIPLGTLFANTLGGYLIGLFVAIFSENPHISPEWRLFLVTGLFGALTTFSSFTAEILANFQAGRPGLALAGIGLHLGGSLLFAWLGMLTVSLVSDLIGSVP